MSETRNAVVTGAAQGIGEAIAIRLSQDGYPVVINDLPSKKELLDGVARRIEENGGKVSVVAADATTEEGIQEMIDTVVKTYGSLDIMVCNAGAAFVKPVLDTSFEEVNELMNINFRAAWLGYSLAAKQMIQQGKGGRIIGAASAAGKKGYPYMAAYSATKFAIRGLTHSSAQEWGGYGITVNAYCPGLIWTPLIESLGPSLGDATGLSDGDPREMWVKTCAMGRIGEPIDVANLVSFFASKDSGFVTGQSWILDGGALFD